MVSYLHEWFIHFIFISKTYLLTKFLIHDVARTYLHRVPTSVIQKEEKSKSKQNKVRGLVKVAVPKEEGLPNLIAYSLHNTKPVHFLSTCDEEVF